MSRPWIARDGQWVTRWLIVRDHESSSMGLPWIARGSPMGLPWASHGSPMGLPWVSHGSPMGLQHWSPKGLPRAPHASPTGLPRSPTGPPCVSCRSPTVSDGVVSHETQMEIQKEGYIMCTVSHGSQVPVCSVGLPWGFIIAPLLNAHDPYSLD